MKSKSPEEWVKQMNDWGAESEPFFFLISYCGEHAYLYPLRDMPSTIQYALPNQRRMGVLALLPEKVYFDVLPPSKDRYAEAFHLVQEEIRSGNSYLLNLCARSGLETNLELAHFFHHARAPYKLLVEDEFCCFSPEAFIHIKDRTISTYPMKGTISASVSDAKKCLLDNEKEQCEHATIVDLLRNDLSRISRHVHVVRYRYVDLIETTRGAIYQTSSEISGELSNDWASRLGDMFHQLLPAGSISGAPKRKTCEIIAAAESMDRGFYTGVFGVFDGESVESAVCIRFVEKEDEKLYYKSGGGITAMSVMEEEYQEVVEKVYVPFAT